MTTDTKTLPVAFAVTSGLFDADETYSTDRNDVAYVLPLSGLSRETIRACFFQGYRARVQRAAPEKGSSDDTIAKCAKRVRDTMANNTYATGGGGGAKLSEFEKVWRALVEAQLTGDNFTFTGAEIKDIVKGFDHDAIVLAMATSLCDANAGNVDPTHDVIKARATKIAKTLTGAVNKALESRKGLSL